MKKACLSFVIVCLLVVLVKNSAYAQKKNTLTLSPAYVDVSLKNPTEEKTVSFFITNNTQQPVSLDLFSIDFQQKDDVGTIGFLGKNADNYSYGLSSFLTFKNPNIEVAPGEREKIDVIITNRQDLTPGSHYAAIVAKQRTQEGDTAVVTPAISGLIYLTKNGGERYNLSFKDISYPSSIVSFSYPATAFLTLQNDGNTYLIPYGLVEIYDMFGRKLSKGTINESSVRVYPQSIRKVPVYFRDISFSLPISVNTMKVSGYDLLRKTKFSYQEVYVYVNPWVIGSIILIAILIVIYKKMVVKRHHKSSHD